MTATEVPTEFRGTFFEDIWGSLAEGKAAEARLAELESTVERLKAQLIGYRDRTRTAEQGRIDEFSKLGYIVLREGGDITDSLNEPAYIQWVRWAMTEGWAELTAPTVELSWAGPQDNTEFADLLKEKLGPLREELGLE